MLNDDDKAADDISFWMDKLFPIDTLVIDKEGSQYLVKSWFILRDQVYVKLAQGVGVKMTVYNVLFEEAMQWARFPPGQIPPRQIPPGQILPGQQLAGSPESEKNTSTAAKILPPGNSLDKFRVDFERSARNIKNRVAEIFRSRPVTAPVDSRANPYRCVSIKYHCNHVCELVLKLKTLPYLSDQPPLFLETEQRFLLSEGIQLPLPGCTVKSCQCRFIQHQDRRFHDRRGHYDLILPLSTSLNSERRMGSDRRSRRPGPRA